MKRFRLVLESDNSYVQINERQLNQAVLALKDRESEFMNRAKYAASDETGKKAQDIAAAEECRETRELMERAVYHL